MRAVFRPSRCSHRGYASNFQPCAVPEWRQAEGASLYGSTCSAYLSRILFVLLSLVTHCLASDSEKERGSLRIQQHTIWSKQNQRDIAENRQCPRRSGVSWQPPFVAHMFFDCLVQWCVPKNCWLSFQKSNSMCKSTQNSFILCSLKRKSE